MGVAMTDSEAKAAVNYYDLDGSGAMDYNVRQMCARGLLLLRGRPPRKEKEPTVLVGNMKERLVINIKRKRFLHSRPDWDSMSPFGTAVPFWRQTT